MATIQLQSTIGLPPGGGTVLDLPMKYSMPVASIVPGEPQLQQSGAVFKIIPKFSKYKELLEEYGYSFPSGINRLNIAFIADNFPTDTFSNEYGPSFLENMMNIGPAGLGQLAQMAGSKSATEMISKFSKFAKDNVDNPYAKNAFSMVGGGAESIGNIFNKMKKEGGMLGTVGSAVNASLAGARLDFPQVWKGSGFSPSYTMTIRLYNPKPADEECTKKYIIGPLAALLLLGLPRASNESNYAYNWPFFNTLRCPGIYFLNPCCITSINVIKGGDQQSIAWNQRLAIVDVRLEFTSLFNTLISGAKGTKDRPTLESYLEAMAKEKNIHERKLPRDNIENIKVTNIISSNENVDKTIKSATGKIAKEATDQLKRTSIQQDLAMGELTKTTNQTKSLKSFASAIVKQAKDATLHPINTMNSAVNLVRDYKNKYEATLNLAGNIKSFDKNNLLSSLSQLSYSLDRFDNEVATDLKKIRVKDVHAKAQSLKNKTDNITPKTISV